LSTVVGRKLKAGDKIPSACELAKKADVNRNTEVKSYHDLEVMRVIYTRRRRGVFVSKDAEAKCWEESRRRVIGRLHEVACGAKAAGMSVREIKEVCKKGYA